MSLVKSVRDFCLRETKNKIYWIALSGGLDSCVLLSIFHSLRMDLQLDVRAIHINHGLSPHANEWALHCKYFCEQLHIPYHERCIHLTASNSIEEAAREKRYAVFAEYLQQDDCLLTAHHQDDQAETILLQLMRGSGLKGLAAMPFIKSFANGYHGRPLLNFSRDELHRYANEQNLKWVEDASNQSIHYSRNFLRHEILSLLKSRWPSVVESVTRSASHCAEAQSLLDEFGIELCQQVQGAQPNTLSAKKMNELSLAKQRLVLRTWIHQQELPLPNANKIKSIQQNVLLAAQDKSPCVEWGNVALRKYQDDLYLVSRSLSKEKISGRWYWDLKQRLEIPRLGVLKSQRVLGQGLASFVTQCSVQFRQGGEMISLPNRGISRTLKNLLQECKVRPWERYQLPLIYIDQQLVAIPGYFVHEDYAAKEDEWGMEISFLTY